MGTPTKISKKNQKAIDDWNKKHPVGTVVDVHKDDGTVVRGATTHEAWALCGHPVVNVEGISGPYALERVRLPDPEADRAAEDARDAARYRRLRVLGVAPYGTSHLETATVMRFTNLDAFVDDDLSYYKRGEVSVPIDTDPGVPCG